MRAADDIFLAPWESACDLSIRLNYPRPEAHRHDRGKDVMNTTTAHETFSLLPADSVAYRCNPEGLGRRAENPPMPAHLRWGEAVSDPQWGWRVAMTHHVSGEPLPPSLRDPDHPPGISISPWQPRRSNGDGDALNLRHTDGQRHPRPELLHLVNARHAQSVA